jgi:hypothetical protein
MAQGKKSTGKSPRKKKLVHRQQRKDQQVDSPADAIQKPGLTPLLDNYFKTFTARQTI